MSDSTRPRGDFARFRDHRYEEHFLDDEGRVLLLSDRGVMLLHSPRFARLQDAAVRGACALTRTIH